MKNTIEGVDIKPHRRCGNTTRQVDYAIQLLYSGYRVQVIDHGPSGKTFSRDLNLNLVRLILDRLTYEHNIQQSNYSVDVDGNIMKLNFNKDEIH